MSQFAILCSGQGAQTPQLFDSFAFSEKGLGVRRSASRCLEPEVAAWLDRSEKSPQIFQNHFSQPLICLYQAMIWAELEALLPRPAMVAGYSLGEVSAYGCAGALAPEEVVRLAAKRAALMDAAGPRGELIAVKGLPARTAAAHDGAYLAIVIGDEHCVIGCVAERAESLAGELRDAGAKDAVILAVTVASHTPILDGAVEPFRDALKTSQWQAPRIPILSGTGVTKVMRREQMETTLPEQIHRTIRWDRVLQRFAESGCRVLLELGPGHQLAHMANAVGLEARGVNEFRSAQGIADWLESALRRSG